VVVVLRVFEFVGQHCEERMQFEWDGVLVEGVYKPRSCVPQSMKKARVLGCERRAYTSALDKRSRSLVLP